MSKKTSYRWIISLGIISFIFILYAAIGTTYHFLSREECPECICEECPECPECICEECPEYPTVEPASISTEASVDNSSENQDHCLGWQGDNFGPEMPLPDIIQGPAIAELWDQETGFCALVKISDSDPDLDWSGSGAYWEADDSCALEDRWPHHRQEYLFDQSDCQVIVDPSLVPTE